MGDFSPMGFFDPMGFWKKDKDPVKLNQPAAVRRDDPTAHKSLDPNKGDAVAEARRRRLALARRTGRSSLRVDLASDGDRPTRSGISIVG